MVSLNDKEAQCLSEVLGNKTCRKILDLLSEKELTGTDIAKELKIPLNTAGYNLKKLIDSRLIETESHFWSVKGKRIPVYKISNKSIVISPKSNKIKTFLPVALIIAGLTATIGYLSNKAHEIPVLLNDRMVNQVSETSGVLYASAPVAQKAIVETTPSFLSWFLATPWLVFLVGSLIGIGVYFLVKRILKGGINNDR